MPEPTPSDASPNPPSTPAPNPPPPVPVAAPAPPPAAVTVAQGVETEEVNTLRQKLAEESGERRKVEQRNMELEDENHRLKTIPKAPRTPARKKTRGFGFFHEEEA